MERTRAELATARTAPTALIALDRETHGALWAASGNAQLERTLDWLYVHVMRLWNYALPRIEGIPALTADHLAIVDAVRARDARHRAPPDARPRRTASSSRSAPPGAASARRTSPTATPPQEPRLAPWP